MAPVSMKALLETGVHFGHRTRKWNPRMKPFIFTERNGIHIIDLQQTLGSLERAYALIRDTVAGGGILLFTGTKRQAQETIELESTRCGMPYVNSRWLGGTLTNWRTIRSRIIELENLEKRRDAGEFELLTKKEALILNREIDRLDERLCGIRNMKRLPDLVYIVDVRREETAIHEANLLNIPVIALVDTNCDPSGVDYVIPSNDDAIRAIKLLTAAIAEAVIEGKALRKDVEEEEVGAGYPVEFVEYERSDEDLLGEATLAKLKSGVYDEKGLGLSEAQTKPTFAPKYYGEEEPKEPEEPEEHEEHEELEEHEEPEEHEEHEELEEHEEPKEPEEPEEHEELEEPEELEELEEPEEHEELEEPEEHEELEELEVVEVEEFEYESEDEEELAVLDEDSFEENESQEEFDSEDE